MEGVLGGYGAEDGVQHQHRGDESFEGVNQGGGLGEVSDDGVLSIDVSERKQIGGVVRENWGWMFVETGGDGDFCCDQV